MAAGHSLDIQDHLRVPVTNAVEKVPFADQGLGFLKLQDVVRVSADGPAKAGSMLPFSEQQMEKSLTALGTDYADSVSRYTRESGVTNESDIKQSTDARRGRFQQRLEDALDISPKGFTDLVRQGLDFSQSHSIDSPRDIGNHLGLSIIRSGIEGGSDQDRVKFLGAVNGVMLAARASFQHPEDPAQVAAQNKEMIDAMQYLLTANGINDIHPVIWGDTKEPGFASKSDTRDLTGDLRYNYTEPPK